MLRRRSRVIGVVGVIGGLALLAACSQDRSTAPTLRSPEDALGKVTVFPLNAIMAVGDTLTLQLSARTLSGAPLTTFDSVEYIPENPTDSLRIRISPAGVVTAVGPSGQNNPVLVQVIAFKGGLVRADLAIVQVTPTRLVGAQLSIQPAPGDSAKMAWGDTKSITPAIFDAANDSVSSPTLRLEYGPGDSTLLQCYAPNFVGTATITQAQLQLSDCGTNGNTGQVGLNQIHAWHKGTAWVHANVMVYNVMLHDSVEYTLSNPYSAPVQMGPTYFLAGQNYRNSVFIAPGGQVAFINGFSPNMGNSVTFVFDKPDLVTASDPPSTYGDTTGNISTLTPIQLLAWRRFNTPGVYTWTATVIGGMEPYAGQSATGTVTVE